MPAMNYVVGFSIFRVSLYFESFFFPFPPSGERFNFIVHLPYIMYILLVNLCSVFLPGSRRKFTVYSD